MRLMKDYYKVQAVSNSALKLIDPEQGGTPKRFKRWYIDKDGVELEETPSLRNGKLIHLYAEDPGSFFISDLNKPSDGICTWVERVFAVWSGSPLDIREDSITLRLLAKDQKGELFSSYKSDDAIWKKFQEGFDYLRYLISADGKIAMDAGTKRVVEAAIDSMRTHPVASKLLFDSPETFGDRYESEFAVYWNSGIDKKGLLDRVRIFPHQKKFQIIDIKTTSYGAMNYPSTFKSYKTYRQLAHYREGLLDWLKTEYPSIDVWNEEYYVISVETTPLYECHVWEIQYDWILDGIKELKLLFDRIAFHQTYGWEQSFEESQNHGTLKLTHDNK
jgi:hypothetical protein